MLRKKRLHDALSSALLPAYLDIQDKSDDHQRPGIETHFTIIIASDKFQPLKRIERHRLVNALMNDEFKTGLHALSLHLYTPSEWEARQNRAPETPPCSRKK